MVICIWITIKKDCTQPTETREICDKGTLKISALTTQSSFSSERYPPHFQTVGTIDTKILAPISMASRVANLKSSD